MSLLGQNPTCTTERTREIKEYSPHNVLKFLSGSDYNLEIQK